MKIILIATVVTVALVGCSARSGPPPTGEKKPVAVATEKPIIEDDGQPAVKEKQPEKKDKRSDVPTDEFGLPLVIVMEVPEVPERINKPSPPIEEDKNPDEAPRKGGGFW